MYPCIEKHVLTPWVYIRPHYGILIVAESTRMGLFKYAPDAAGRRPAVVERANTSLEALDTEHGPRSSRKDGMNG